MAFIHEAMLFIFNLQFEQECAMGSFNTVIETLIHHNMLMDSKLILTPQQPYPTETTRAMALRSLAQTVLCAQLYEKQGQQRQGSVKSEEEMVLHEFVGILGARVDVLLHALPEQLRQFVCRLQARGHPHCALPVVIVEALLEREGDQGFLGHLGPVVHHLEDRGGAGSLGDLLGGQVEAVEAACVEGLDDHRSGIGVVEHLGLHGVVAAVDFLVDDDADGLGLVVLGLGLVPDDGDHVLESRDFGSRNLVLDLGVAEPLSVEDDGLGHLALVVLEVALGPLDENLFEGVDGDLLLAGDVDSHVAVDLRAVVADGPHESQSVAVLSLRQADRPVHHVSRLEVLVALGDDPGGATHLDVHLDGDLRCGREGSLGIAEGAALDELAGAFDHVDGQFLELLVELLLLGVDQEQDDLWLSVDLDVLHQSVPPALNISASHREMDWLFEGDSIGCTGLDQGGHRLIHFLLVSLAVWPRGVDDQPVLEVLGLVEHTSVLDEALLVGLDHGSSVEDLRAVQDQAFHNMRVLDGDEPLRAVDLLDHLLAVLVSLVGVKLDVGGDCLHDCVLVSLLFSEASGGHELGDQVDVLGHLLNPVSSDHLVDPVDHFEQGLLVVRHLQPVHFQVVLLVGHRLPLLDVVESAARSLGHIHFLDGVGSPLAAVVGLDDGAGVEEFVLRHGGSVEDGQQVASLEDGGADVDLERNSRRQRDEGQLEASLDDEPDLLNLWVDVGGPLVGEELPFLAKFGHVGVPQGILQVDVEDLQQLALGLLGVQIAEVELPSLSKHRFELEVSPAIFEDAVFGGRNIAGFGAPDHLPFVAQVPVVPLQLVLDASDGPVVQGAVVGNLFGQSECELVDVGFLGVDFHSEVVGEELPLGGVLVGFGLEGPSAQKLVVGVHAK